MNNKKYRYVSLKPSLISSLFNGLLTTKTKVIIFLSLVVLSLLGFGFACGLPELIINNIQSVNLRNIIGFALMTLNAVIYLIGLFFFWRWLIRIYRKQKSSIVKDLKYFLSSHELYEIRDNELFSSAQLGYLETDNQITIRVSKTGGKYDKKLADIGADLSALLKLPLDNRIETVSTIDYIFQKSRPERLILSNKPKEENSTTKIPLNTQLHWDIKKQPHMLIAGVTGGGKSVFINYLLIEFLKMGSTLYIADAKNSDLGSLKAYLGDSVATSANHIARITREAKETMDKRYEEVQAPDKFIYGADFLDYGYKPVAVFFDEVGAFRASADKKTYEETMKNLTEIILKGRQVGVFCVLSTQQPNANNIPTELRDNLSVRVALGNMSDEAYRMVFGDTIDSFESITEVGSGYIYLDGLGWNSPRYFETPYYDNKQYDFLAELQKYI